jgi:hypothetical protein
MNMIDHSSTIISDENERCIFNTVNSNLSTDSFITDNLEKAQLSI